MPGNGPGRRSLVIHFEPAAQNRHDRLPRPLVRLLDGQTRPPVAFVEQVLRPAKRCVPPGILHMLPGYFACPQADETRVPVLQQEGKGRNDIAWFWQYSRPGGLVYFDCQNSRSRAGPSHFLSDFKGRLQSDGYEVYTALGLNLQSHAGCWAHARRKFDQARKAAPKEAPCPESQEGLDLIARLYAVESGAREAQLDPQARLRLRQDRGVPAQLDALCKRIIQIRQQALPASLLAKACDSLLAQWNRFCVFAADGLIEIDNNSCENGMRPIALGRKNGMHLGSEQSGPPVAAIMTVLASAQRAGVNIRLYLAHGLEKLADRSFTTHQIQTLLPEIWKSHTS
jgi:transposase